MPSRDPAVRLAIAGTVLGVDGLRGEALRWTRQRYRTFLSNRAAAITIAVDTTRRRLPVAQPPVVAWSGDTFEFAIGPARAQGTLANHHVRLTMPATLTPMNPTIVRLLTSFLLFQRDSFLLHAAAVVHRGRALAFCGPSGSGKTTVARMAGRRRVLNDDTVAVRRGRDGFRAWATPFFGDGGPAMAARNVSARLAAIFFLEKAERFGHRRLSAADAIARAIPEVFLPKHDALTAERLLAALVALAAEVPCYALTFARSPDLWEYVDAVA
jgi:hypothetical protein